MKNELGRVFIFFLGAVVIFVSLFAVFDPKGKKINLKEIEFSTTKSSELYFKNMRSYFYDKEEINDSKFLLYRINNREKDSNKVSLHFLLVHNWLLNECYLVAEPQNVGLQVEWEYEDELGTIELTGENNRAHFVFGAEVFEQLERNATLWWVDSDTKKVLPEAEKSSLKTSLKDYFKLVGKLR